VGTLLAGMLLFKESVTVVRLMFASLIVIGVVGLQMTTVV
jgi:multidrug transporter EmrE-like cation transporter